MPHSARPSQSILPLLMLIRYVTGVCVSTAVLLLPFFYFLLYSCLLIYSPHLYSASLMFTTLLVPSLTSFFFFSVVVECFPLSTHSSFLFASPSLPFPYLPYISLLPISFSFRSLSFFLTLSSFPFYFTSIIFSITFTFFPSPLLLIIFSSSPTLILFSSHLSFFFLDTIFPLTTLHLFFFLLPLGFSLSLASFNIPATPGILVTALVYLSDLFPSSLDFPHHQHRHHHPSLSSPYPQ